MSQIPVDARTARADRHHRRRQQHHVRPLSACRGDAGDLAVRAPMKRAVLPAVRRPWRLSASRRRRCGRMRLHRRGDARRSPVSGLPLAVSRRRGSVLGPEHRGLSGHRGRPRLDVSALSGPRGRTLASSALDQALGRRGEAVGREAHRAGGSEGCAREKAPTLPGFAAFDGPPVKLSHPSARRSGWRSRRPALPGRTVVGARRLVHRRKCPSCRKIWKRALLWAVRLCRCRYPAGVRLQVKDATGRRRHRRENH